MIMNYLACSIVCMALGAVPFSEDVNEEKLKKQLTKHEGKRVKVYLDSEGIPTIGIGFNLKREDAKSKIESLGLKYKDVVDGIVSLNDSQIDTLLDADVKSAIADCKSVVDGFGDLSDVRKRVLVDMVFNLGKTRFSEFEKMLAAVKEKDFEKAAAEMKDSKWCEQVKTRCATLENMMKTDKDPSWLSADD